MWNMIKRELVERFITFEAFNGGIIMIPWGMGFLYYGIPWQVDLQTALYLAQQPQFGYNYALISVGLVQIVWGLRKLLVNRVKQQAKFEELVKRRRMCNADSIKS